MGARTLKTTLSILLSLFIANFLNLNLLLAGLGSINTMEKTAYKTKQAALSQLYANFLAGILAILIGMIFNVNILTIGAAVLAWMFIIRFFNIFKLKIDDLVKIGTLTLLAVLTVDAINMYEFTYEAIIRVLSITTGVVVSFIINITIFRPKINNYMQYEIKQIIHIAKILSKPKQAALDHRKFFHYLDIIDTHLVNLLNLRKDYIKEHDSKLLHLKSKADQADTIHLLVDSFLRLHVLLETIHEKQIILKDETFLNLINYHNDLCSNLFEENVEAKSICTYLNLKAKEEKIISAIPSSEYQLIGDIAEYFHYLRKLEKAICSQENFSYTIEVDSKKIPK